MAANEPLLQDGAKESWLMDFLVVGGRQDPNAFRKNEWHRYKEGIVVRAESKGKRARVCLRYRSPPEVCASDHDPSIVFKAGTLNGDRLYLCTQTEVLVYTIPTFRLERHLSLPFFNDLHHVRPSIDDSLLVAVTGLDLVVDVTPEGEIIKEWGVLGQDPWDRFSRSVDYRRVVTTKPHHSHPNYVFYIGNDIWVTRFEQRDAVCLTRKEQVICLPIEKPHDGCVVGERVYFTSVDGHVIVVDKHTKEVVRIADLNAISTPQYALGWCRGLCVLSDRLVVVGFSRLRPTVFRENIRWVRYELGLRETRGNLATRIVCYDLLEEREVWEIDLESVGMNAVFSIHAIPSDTGWG